MKSLSVSTPHVEPVSVSHMKVYGMTHKSTFHGGNAMYWLSLWHYCGIQTGAFLSAPKK